MNHSVGWVSLVGAGPGDPELITLRGLRRLEQADCILYDALANDELLAWAPPEAERIFVGKRAGKHALPQAQINALLVEKALQGLKVVRLKGGDPWVYGRGYEEVWAVAEAGIPCEVVPGVSSLTAATSLVGIPLTARGVNQSFRVLTAVDHTCGLPAELHRAIQANEVIIVFMGLKKIAEISDLYTLYGHDAPAAAVVFGASRPHQQVVRGRLSELTRLTIDNPTDEPALLLIGPNTGLEPAPVTYGSALDEAYDPVAEAGGFRPVSNPLYPVFLKAHDLPVLIVGGGHVGTEKLTNLLRSSPETRVRLVAPVISPGIRQLAASHPYVTLVEREFNPDTDFEGIRWVLSATEHHELNLAIRNWAHERRLLVNVADTPAACDFYLGAVVQQGPIKLGISTHGSSPTLAKRLKEVFQAALPAELGSLAYGLRHIRNRLQGAFGQKVQALNQLTAQLIATPAPQAKNHTTRTEKTP